MFLHYLTLHKSYVAFLSVRTVNSASARQCRVSFFFCKNVETQLRCGGKLCTHLIAKTIRIPCAKFYCNR